MGKEDVSVSIWSKLSEEDIEKLNEINGFTEKFGLEIRTSEHGVFLYLDRKKCTAARKRNAGKPRSVSGFFKEGVTAQAYIREVEAIGIDATAKKYGISISTAYRRLRDAKKADEDTDMFVFGNIQ